MYEYKVEVYKVKAAEKEMNTLAGEGWRVIAVTPNQAMGYGIVVTYERQKTSDRKACDTEEETAEIVSTMTITGIL